MCVPFPDRGGVSLAPQRRWLAEGKTEGLLSPTPRRRESLPPFPLPPSLRELSSAARLRESPHYSPPCVREGAERSGAGGLLSSMPRLRAPTKIASAFQGSRKDFAQQKICGKRSSEHLGKAARITSGLQNLLRCDEAVLFIIPYSRPKEKTLAQNFCTFFRETGAARKT